MCGVAVIWLCVLCTSLVVCVPWVCVCEYDRLCLVCAAVSVRAARPGAQPVVSVRLAASTGRLLDSPRQLGRCSAGQLLLQPAAGVASASWLLPHTGGSVATLRIRWETTLRNNPGEAGLPDLVVMWRGRCYCNLELADKFTRLCLKR